MPHRPARLRRPLAARPWYARSPRVRRAHRRARGRSPDRSVRRAARIPGAHFYDANFQGFTFERRRAPIAAILAKLIEQADDAEPPGLYAGGTDAAAHLPGFAAAHPMPLLPPGTKPRIWIGNAAPIAPHYDLAHNIAVCVADPRRFTLFPPDQVANLYVGPIEHTIAGQPPSLVDLEVPDLGRFPRFAQALAVAEVAELQPGDALYIPALWWHGGRSNAPLGVLVNYWWGQGYGRLAIRGADPRAADGPRSARPERAAWEAVFRHYIFDPAPPPTCRRARTACLARRLPRVRPRSAIFRSARCRPVPPEREAAVFPTLRLLSAKVRVSVERRGRGPRAGGS